MSETIAFRPLHGRHHSSRVLVTLAVAVLIATAFAVILLIAAVRDSGESRPNAVPTAEVPPPAGADFSQDVCEPSRVVTAC